MGHSVALPGPDEGFGVVGEHGAPLVVLLAALGHLPAALRLQLLRDGPDVVWLHAAAPADVPHAQLVGLPRVLGGDP